MEKEKKYIENSQEQRPENVDTIFIIPMRGCPVFPGLLTTIEVTDHIDMISVKYSENQKGFGLLLLKDDTPKGKTLQEDDFYSVGTFVRVKNKVNTVYGSKSLYLETICRFKVLELKNVNDVISATVRFIEEKPLDPLTNKAYIEAIKKALSLREDNSFLMNNLRMNAYNIPESVRLTDYLASMIVPREEQQEFLENLDLEDRMKKILKLLHDELTVQKMQEEIQVSVSKRLEKWQREHFLREELYEIKRQLAKLHKDEEKEESIDDDDDFIDLLDVDDLDDIDDIDDLDDDLLLGEDMDDLDKEGGSEKAADSGEAETSDKADGSKKSKSDKKSDKLTKEQLKQAEKDFKRALAALKKNKGEESEQKEGSDERKPARKKKLIDKLKDLNLTGEAYETVFEEYHKLQKTEKMSPEYPLIRSYLETVAALPWNKFSEEKIDLAQARKILDKDHYGIKEVKERILEFLAIRKLKQDTKGSIICLVGPPGTGKTSVGISIAKALGKKYYRFSVGGMRDEAEIKGHRRTYIGSMPGQIIKGLKVCGTMNPVFVIDEIDKMTSSAQGDPASAMLEVLDPEQNTAFKDHYLDIPFDISNVFFIVTANTTETIPRPLLDRMECIEMNGYTPEEKLHIGKKYLVPKMREKNGLKTTDIKFTDHILRKIAEEYAREAGVRNFEKSLDKISRKVVMQIVESEFENKNVPRPIVIDDKTLVEYLGQPIFREDELIKADKVGMAVGLAWTSMGGDTLAIEAQTIPGKGELKLTGQLGDVMKESASIAFSYLKNIQSEYNVPKNFFKEHNIHLHIPEGATPKDGPSAGITMASAMFSLMTGKIIKPALAMTGELSLLGKVMPIGGLKEKILAAGRNKIKEIIIPKRNQRDLDKIDEPVKKGIKFHLVEDMSEVIEIAFPNVKKKLD